MRVLVTRPQPGATETAARLAALGYEPILLPLTEVRWLPVAAGDLPASADAVVATSANALRHLPPEIARSFAQQPFYAVGKATAAAARRAGFAHVEDGDGDAAALAGAIEAKMPSGSSILYLCGRVRLPDFERKLAEAGMSVAAVETYDTVAAPPSLDALEAAIGPRPIDAILLHSAATAEVLVAALAELAPRLAPRVRFICLSARIAAALDQDLPGAISIAAEPTEAALVSELSRLSA
jgi:uroporphyrinogen-III synthase